MNHKGHSAFIAVLACLFIGLCIVAPVAHATSESTATVRVGSYNVAAAPHVQTEIAAAKAQTDEINARDLGLPEGTVCSQNAQTTANPSGGPLPDVAVTLTDDAPANAPTFTLPTAIHFTLTVTNIGDAATPTPFTVIFSHPDVVGPRFELWHIPALAINATKTFTGVLHYTTSGYHFYMASADTGCLFAEKTTSNNYSTMRGFAFLVQGVDLASSGINSRSITPHVGDGNYTSGDKYNVSFYIDNFGLTSPTADVSVSLVSPLFGKPLTAMVKKTELPAPGDEGHYYITDAGSSAFAVFVAPQIKAPKYYPITSRIKTATGDKDTTAKNNSAITRLHIVPPGVNLYPFGSYLLYPGCVPVVGDTHVTLSTGVKNGGTLTSAPTKGMVYFDNKLLNTYDIPALAPGAFYAMAQNLPFVITKAGKHTLRVLIVPNSTTKEYVLRDNTLIQSYVFRA